MYVDALDGFIKTTTGQNLIRVSDSKHVISFGETLAYWVNSNNSTEIFDLKTGELLQKLNNRTHQKRLVSNGVDTYSLDSVHTNVRLMGLEISNLSD